MRRQLVGELSEALPMWVPRPAAHPVLTVPKTVIHQSQRTIRKTLLDLRGQHGLPDTASGMHEDRPRVGGSHRVQDLARSRCQHDMSRHLDQIQCRQQGVIADSKSSQHRATGNPWIGFKRRSSISNNLFQQDVLDVQSAWQQRCNVCMKQRIKLQQIRG
ncbi:MAG: hypothetical protein ACRDTG_16455 [Pseudonocardiaceae bacterium]